MVRSELTLLFSARADATHAKAEEVVDLFFGEMARALTTEGRVETRQGRYDPYRAQKTHARLGVDFEP